MRRESMYARNWNETVLKKVGPIALATGLFFTGQASTANAEITCPNCPCLACDDLKTLGEIVSFLKGSFDYVTGASNIIKFLTGYNPPNELTMKAIEAALAESEDKRYDHNLVVKAKILADLYRELFDELQTQKARGKTDDQLFTMFSQIYSTIFNAASHANFNRDATELWDFLEDVVALPSTDYNSKRVAMVLPAYLSVIPLKISSLSLLNEIEPSGKPGRDQTINELLVRAQQTLFDAVGAFVLDAYECGKPQSVFYSPVGTDNRWMAQRPLFKYYLTRGPVPVLGMSFSVYEGMSIANHALAALERITNDIGAPVIAENAYILNLQTDPNIDSTKPSFAQCALGSIASVYHYRPAQ
jgi:hypothetical protein